MSRFIGHDSLIIDLEQLFIPLRKTVFTHSGIFKPFGWLVNATLILTVSDISVVRVSIVYFIIVSKNAQSLYSSLAEFQLISSSHANDR